MRIIKNGEYYDYYVNVDNIYLPNECKKNNKISIKTSQFKFVYKMYLFYLLINKNNKFFEDIKIEEDGLTKNIFYILGDYMLRYNCISDSIVQENSSTILFVTVKKIIYWLSLKNRKIINKAHLIVGILMSINRYIVLIYFDGTKK